MDPLSTEAARLMADKIAFLILSNPRTGSTWLQTSLGDLPDVAVNYELKWGPIMHVEPTGVQRTIRDKTVSCRSLLTSISQSSRIVGSKLVLSGAVPIPTEQASDLAGTIDPDIRIMHLTRPYFDILSSSFGHGAVHLIDRPYLESKDAGMVQELQSNSQPKLRAIPEKSAQTVIDDVVLYQLARVRRRLGIGKPFRYVPYENIISLLLIFFVNDIALLEVRRRAKQWLHIRYSDVISRFHEIVAFVGSQAEQSRVQYIIEHPVTRKLDAVRGDLMANHRSIRRVANLLDEARDRAFQGMGSVTDLWHWDAKRKIGLVRVDGLAAAVEAGRKLWERRRSAGGPLTWEFK
jgi:hypothetical protein